MLGKRGQRGSGICLALCALTIVVCVTDMAAKRLPCVPKNLCFAPNLFSPHPVLQRACIGCCLEKRPRVVATATIERAGAAVSYSEGKLLRPISGSNTLSEDGIVSVPVSISMVDDIQASPDAT